MLCGYGDNLPMVELISIYENAQFDYFRKGLVKP